MAKFKPEQRHLTIQGRAFHFVSYEGGSTHRRSPQPPDPAMWYLMVEGRRWPVLPCDPQLSPVEIDTTLAAWVVANALGPVKAPDPVFLPGPTLTTQPRWANWWGPG